MAYLRPHMEIAIHRIEAHEYQLLAQIGRDPFYETWRSVNTEEDMQTYMAKAFDPSSIEKDILNPANTFLLPCWVKKQSAIANCAVIGRMRIRIGFGN
ncbi:MAG: hypothetical protein IPP51_11960 [Bacteroidetes bacterium]|nr:hypothetical protein [Bacteroidota bacterium]